MANAPSYASPQTSGQVRRSQYLADAIRQLQQTPKDVYNTAEGTNYNILANAILGYQSNQADRRADRMLADDKTRVADMIRGQFPDQQGVANQQLNADKPFDLTPAGNQQRTQESGIGNLASMIFETTGDPTAAINAGMGQKRQMLEDQRYADEQKYARGRDARNDFVVDRGFNQGVDQFNRNFGEGVRQFDANFGQNADQFGQTMGFQNKQLGETIRHNKAGEANDAATIAAKEAAAAAKANGSAVFDGPQLATIYNKNMDALDTVRGAQENYDTIAQSAQQFVDQVGDDNWLQGSGWWNDLMQAGSMKTSDLKALTDRIAPLMRKPGSGSSSDTDVQMFRNSVVNVNNTPEANKRFAAGAMAMATRNREYSEFLNSAITPEDPQSRQKADRIWSLYKNDQNLFDPKTGELNTAAQSFPDWFAEHTQPEQSEQPVRINSAAERDALPPGTPYTAPDGSVMIKR